MSRTQSFTSTDKEKNPPTPRSKIGHRRVDETGETTYKKVCLKKLFLSQILFQSIPGIQLATCPICTFSFGSYYLFFLSFFLFVFVFVFSTCTFPIKFIRSVEVKYTCGWK